jgi:hypothetical protein
LFSFISFINTAIFNNGSGSSGCKIKRSRAVARAVAVFIRLLLILFEFKLSPFKEKSQRYSELKLTEKINKLENQNL